MLGRHVAHAISTLRSSMAAIRATPPFVVRARVCTTDMPWHIACAREKLATDWAGVRARLRGLNGHSSAVGAEGELGVRLTDENRPG